MPGFPGRDDSAKLWPELQAKLRGEGGTCLDFRAGTIQQSCGQNSKQSSEEKAGHAWISGQGRFSKAVARTPSKAPRRRRDMLGFPGRDDSAKLWRELQAKLRGE